MKIVAEQAHREPAELDDDVRASGDFLDRGFPPREDFLAPAGIAADADRPAAMIEHDFRVRKGAGEVGEFADLRMKQPGVEAQAQWREAGKALAEGAVEQQPFRPRRIHAGDIGVRIPRRRVPDAAEAAVAGNDLRLQHRLRAVAEQQIDVADDAGADRGLAVAAACRHRRDAIRKLDLADGPERLGAVRAVHRAAIDIDGGDDVVAGSDVSRHLLDHVAQAAAVPEMVMRIDDRTRGIDDLLTILCEPVLARIGVEPALRGGCSAGGHECRSLGLLLA